MADRQSPQGNARAGTGRGEDSTNMPGQYPDQIFGLAVPQSSGARGSAPGRPDPTTSVNQSGQYPANDPFTGVAFPQAGSGDATQPPGSAGRGAGDQRVTPPSMTSPPGLFYASTEAEHALESIPGRSDGQYPPTTETYAVTAPMGTGAGGGSARGPGHPNAESSPSGSTSGGGSGGRVQGPPHPNAGK